MAVPVLVGNARRISGDTLFPGSAFGGSAGCVVARKRLRRPDRRRRAEGAANAATRSTSGAGSRWLRLTNGNTAKGMASANKAGDARNGLRSQDHGVGT